MKINKDLPKGANTHEQRQAIARALTLKIDEYRASMDGMRDRWAVNEAFYRNQPEEYCGAGHAVVDSNGNVYEGSLNRVRKVADWQATEHHPVTQPIIDAFVAQQYNAITMNSEYVSGETYGQSKELTINVGKTIQHFYKAGGFDDALDELLLITALTGVAFLRQTMTVDVDGLLSTRSNPDIMRSGPIRYAGLNFDVIHPRDIAVYPVNAPNIEACSVVAHRVQMMRRAEIVELQKAGRYLSKDEVGGLTETTGNADEDESAASIAWSRGMDDSINATEPGDHQIEVWTGLAKLALTEKDEFERWYEFVLAKGSDELLQIREYAYPRPWYFPFYVKREPGRLIPRSSPAQDLQGLQRSTNELYNQYLDAAYAATLPCYVAEESAIVDQDIQLTPGKIVPISGLTKETFQQFPIGANQEAALQAIQHNVELAQLVARVSSNSMGNSIPSGTTATEASIIQAGNSANANYALRVFSRGLAEAWGFAQMLIADEFALMKQFYGDAIPVPEMDEATGMAGEQAMRWPIRWDVTGKEVNSNQAANYQTLVTLLSVAGQLQQMGMPVFDIPAIGTALANASGLTDAYNILLDPAVAEQQRAEFQAQQQARAQIEQLAAVQQVAGMGGGESGSAATGG
jgi:hypothetical protein